jgi:hypothetical protein
MLTKITLKPGLDKQSSDTGAEGRWVNGDYMRFRYSYPEKIGGWQQLTSSNLIGAGRDQHAWVDNTGNKYVAIGTNKILYVYFEGAVYDITPIDTTKSQTTVAIGSTNGSAFLTLTFPTAHNLEVGDIMEFRDSSTVMTGVSTSFTTSDFDGKLFEVLTTPSTTTLTVEMTTLTGNIETGTGGAIATTTVDPYYQIGPVTQGYGYGWGTNTFGGRVIPPTLTTLNGALADDTQGNNGSATEITLTSTTGFTVPSSSTEVIQVDNELIGYTGITGNKVTGITRAYNGSTRSSHSNGATVYDASSYVGWGSASSSAQVVIEPGQWRLLNYGENLLALVHNKKVFEWDPLSGAGLTNRATVLANAPTASRDMAVSTPDRHLVFIGTETTIGSPGTQDDMFVRFSDQESINATDSYTPSATNTAGSQRLPDGSKLMAVIAGKTALYVWSDTAMYTMKFVGQPFTFGFEQVGTNCGISSQHAPVEIDGVAYWMGPNGFFKYTGGRVYSMPCLVEDYVFEDINVNANQQIHGAVNNLFGEVTWFYCSQGSDEVNRSVSYNYIESSDADPIWTTSSLARTTWTPEGVYGKPYATQYVTGVTPTEPVVNGVTNGASYFWQHEIGTDEVFSNGTTNAIAANIESGDYDISKDQGLPGEGEYMMRISRFIPDFGAQTGNAQVTLSTKAFPNSSAVNNNFTATTSTTQLNTRIRARQIAFKVANTGTGENWRLGTFRLDIHAGGRR